MANPHDLYSWQPEFVRFLEGLPRACVVHLSSPGGEGKSHLAHLRKDLPSELWLPDENAVMSTRDAIALMQHVASGTQRRVLVLSNTPMEPMLGADGVPTPDEDEEDGSVYVRRFGPNGRIVADVTYCPGP